MPPSSSAGVCRLYGRWLVHNVDLHAQITLCYANPFREDITFIFEIEIPLTKAWCTLYQEFLDLSFWIDTTFRAPTLKPWNPSRSSPSKQFTWSEAPLVPSVGQRACKASSQIPLPLRPSSGNSFELSAWTAPDPANTPTYDVARVVGVGSTTIGALSRPAGHLRWASPDQFARISCLSTLGKEAAASALVILLLNPTHLACPWCRHAGQWSCGLSDWRLILP